MKFLRLLILVLMVVALAATQAGRFLVVDKPEKSDAIVVLAGETSARPARGVELLRQGMAPRLYLDAEDGEQVYNEPLTEIAKRYFANFPEADRIS